MVMLVLDSMRAHISDISKERIQATDSILAVIPGGLTKLLQPLDISVNKTFKAMGIMDVPRGKEFHQHRPHATYIVSDRRAMGKRRLEYSTRPHHH
jgi:hypothetical protein